MMRGENMELILDKNLSKKIYLIINKTISLRTKTILSENY